MWELPLPLLHKWDECSWLIKTFHCSIQIDWIATVMGLCDVGENVSSKHAATQYQQRVATTIHYPPFVVHSLLCVYIEDQISNEEACHCNCSQQVALLSTIQHPPSPLPSQFHRKGRWWVCVSCFVSSHATMQDLVTIYIDINPGWLAWLLMIYCTTLTLLILPNDCALCDYSHINTIIVLQISLIRMWSKVFHEDIVKLQVRSSVQAQVQVKV